MDALRGRAEGAGQIILLDGASRSGKTTLARALQASLGRPYHLVPLEAPGFDTWLGDCVRTLRRLPVLFVGVRCAVAELERRERARGDRDVGPARWQSTRVHRHGVYDVEVDTHLHDVAACVAAVREGLARSGGALGRAFEALDRRFAAGP